MITLYGDSCQMSMFAVSGYAPPCPQDGRRPQRKKKKRQRQQRIAYGYSTPRMPISIHITDAHNNETVHVPLTLRVWRRQNLLQHVMTARVWARGNDSIRQRIAIRVWVRGSRSAVRGVGVRISHVRSMSSRVKLWIRRDGCRTL